MTQQKMTPDQVFDNLKYTINTNFRNQFGPMALPRESFTCDDPDAIEPHDLERAENPEFLTRMRHWLSVNDMQIGRAVRQFDIDARIVKAEVRKMRLGDPTTNGRVREALNGPMRGDHKRIADWLGVNEADVDQVARDLLSESSEFLRLIGEAA